MSEVIVRPMTLEDLDRVAAIEAASFPVPWSRSTFEKEIKKNLLARYMVVEVGQQPVAYGGMWFIIDEAHVTNIAVDPSQRGKKLGQALVEGMIQEAKANGMLRMTLEVRRSNEIAKNLYQKMGFLPCGVRPGYYEDNGEDAIIMWKELVD